MVVVTRMKKLKIPSQKNLSWFEGMHFFEEAQIHLS
jgi:hypothetical protein